MLDLVLLRTFVSVVDTGNFTRAGEHLHLTQSTVSQQVIRLEQNLGCRLLDRSQRQVLPTEEGERLLGYARRLLRLSDEASEALSPAHGDGVLRLGVPEDLAGEVLMPVLTRFTEERPRLRLEVESGLSHHLLRLYRSGELDLLLVKQWGRQRLPCTLGRAAGLVRQRHAAVRRGFAGGAGAAGGVPGRRAVSPGDDPCPGEHRASLAHRLFQRQPGQPGGRGRRRTGVSLLPLGCVGPSIACLARAGRLPAHRWPGAGARAAELDSAGRTLRDRLRDLCDARLEGLQGER